MKAHRPGEDVPHPVIRPVGFDDEETASWLQYAMNPLSPTAFKSGGR